MERKLQVKDYITIGVIVAIYFIGFNIIGGGLTALSTKLLFISQGIASLILAPLYMLFIAKIQKNWSILIFGFIMTSILFVLFGGAWPMAFGYIGVIIAEFVARSGDYKSATKNIISYVFFAYWSIGVALVYYLLGDKLLKSTGFNSEQIADFMSNITTQTLIVGLLVIAVLSFIGGLIGKKMLKKHFERAGIV